jgi:hypothetical protein
MLEMCNYVADVQDKYWRCATMLKMCKLITLEMCNYVADVQDKCCRYVSMLEMCKYVGDVQIADVGDVQIDDVAHLQHLLCFQCVQSTEAYNKE